MLYLHSSHRLDWLSTTTTTTNNNNNNDDTNDNATISIKSNL